MKSRRWGIVFCAVIIVALFSADLLLWNKALSPDSTTLPTLVPTFDTSRFSLAPLTPTPAPVGKPYRPVSDVVRRTQTDASPAATESGLTAGDQPPKIAPEVRQIIAQQGRVRVIVSLKQPPGSQRSPNAI